MMRERENRTRGREVRLRRCFGFGELGWIRPRSGIYVGGFPPVGVGFGRLDSDQPVYGWSACRPGTARHIHANRDGGAPRCVAVCGGGGGRDRTQMAEEEMGGRAGGSTALLLTWFAALVLSWGSLANECLPLRRSSHVPRSPVLTCLIFLGCQPRGSSVLPRGGTPPPTVGRQPLAPARPK